MATYTSNETMMDDFAEMAVFTVYELTNKGLVYTSVFDSKENAKKYVRKFGKQTSVLYIYKSYCIKKYDAIIEEEQEESEEEALVDNNDENLVCCVDEEYESEEDSDYDPNNDDDAPSFEEQHYNPGNFGDLSAMTLYSYGKGYLVVPSENDPKFGLPYLFQTHDEKLGWWISKQNGWFFKSECYDRLLNSYVKFAQEDEVSESENEEEAQAANTLVQLSQDTQTNNKSVDMSSYLSHMTFEEYGKGYMLYTGKKDKLFGKHYMLDVGYWNNKAQGWFFKSKYYDLLIDHGAQFIKSEPVTNNTYVCSDDDVLSGPTFVKHGRAWLLKEDDKFTFDDSKKYFEGGFYNKSLKGWIFKTAAKKAFVSKYC